MTDRVLLTGVSGFLGLHVAFRLLCEGYTVRGSVRDMARADAVRSSLAAAGARVEGLSFVQLDLKGDWGWQVAASDCRYVVHTASPFVTKMPKDEGEIIRPAVEGTERAIQAALASDVERVVLTSSMAAMAHGHGASAPSVYSEMHWTNLDCPAVNAYDRSKTLAEQRAWDLMRQAGRTESLAVINPGTLLGPLLDQDPGTSATILIRLMRGEVPAVPRLSLVYADVRDAAEVHVAAMTSAEAGGRRIPVGEKSRYMSDVAALLRARMPHEARAVPRFTMPDWLTRLYATFNDEIASSLDILGIGQAVDSAPAEALLGRPLRSDEEAILAAAESLTARGLV